MTSPLIAIVGSADAERTDYAFPLVDPQGSKQAAEELGRELAKAGCRIVVYSSSPKFIEADVVRGYVTSGVGQPNAIRVCFPRDKQATNFPEYDSHRELFEFKRDRSDEWESSFYRSLNDADGVLLIGGGRSTSVTGYVALGYRIPVLAIQAFGGNAERIWKELNPGQDLATPEDIQIMGEPWSSASAERCVRALLNQHNRRQREREERERTAQELASQRRNTAIVAGVFLILTIATLPLSFGWFQIPTLAFLFLFFFVGLLAGASGSTINSLWRDDITDSLSRTSVLGAAAGVISALLFILAQVVSVPEALGIGPKGSSVSSQPLGLLIFMVPIGFAAGFTFDAVFKKMSSVDVLETDSLKRRGS